jgi:hypothetical protein
METAAALTLSKFLETLTANQPADAFFFFPTRRGTHWSEPPPVNRVSLLSQVSRLERRLRRREEVFFTPNGFPFPRRTTPPSDHEMWVLVADLDPPAGPQTLEAAEIPYPTAVVCSGRGHHFYWVLRESVPLTLWRSVERKLCNLLGADQVSANPTQVFRLPGAYNPRVEQHAHLASLNPRGFHSIEVFTERLLLVPETKPRVENGKEQAPRVLPPEDRLALVEAHAKRLSLWSYAWLGLRREPFMKGGSIDRSQLIWTLVVSLLEAGFSRQETFQLIAGAPWDKFTAEGRPQDLWKLIQLA